jgi:hypothetical protein
MHRTIIATAVTVALLVAGCSKKEVDINSLPANGANEQLPPQPVSAPRAPDPGTYTGVERRYGQRPPQSGLNADPSNPNGAPGNYAGPGIVR